MARANQKRLFADVVTVDAWHPSFDGSAAIVTMFVDVVFDVGRIGGESDAPVRFRLGLRRAEVAIITPANEPVEVIRESVSRDGSGVGSFHPAGSAGAVGGSLIGPTTASAVISPTQPHSGGMLSRQSQDADGNYRWNVFPADGTVLVGRPWDAAATPRLRLRDTRSNHRRLEPAVRVEVRCRMEDLEITDIQPKDETLAAKLREMAGYENRRAAAEAYIRQALVEEGLAFGEFHDPFGRICLADVTAEDQNSQ